MNRFPTFRGNNIPPTPPTPPRTVTQKTPPPKPPPKRKKKFDFKSFKKDTCTSLNDIEHFLCDFNTFLKYVKLYKLLKK